MCGLDQLISGLGTERFCPDLLSYVGSAGTVDHAAVIRFDAQAQARVTVSATRPALRINGQHVRDAAATGRYAGARAALFARAHAAAGLDERQLAETWLADLQAKVGRAHQGFRRSHRVMPASRHSVATRAQREPRADLSALAHPRGSATAAPR